MKKILALTLMLALLLNCFSPALALTAEYANTQDFINMLDENDIGCSLRGINDKGDERLSISFDGDDHSYTLQYFFCKDNELVDIYIWNIIDFKEADMMKVMRAVNEANNAYRFVTFSVDMAKESMLITIPGDSRISGMAKTGRLYSSVRILEIQAVIRPFFTTAP